MTQDYKREIPANLRGWILKLSMLLLICSTLCPIELHATNIVKNKPSRQSTAKADLNITGTVKDAEGQTLPGVSVSLKGTTTGVTTDANGHYSLKVPDQGGVLVFSFIGYTTVEEVINGRSTINTVMKEESKALSEVVVIGYGTVKKRDLTGSVASIKGEEIGKVPAQNIMESLQGKIPGADITRNSGQTGSGVSITLRGNRSIGGTNSPLFIVDGAIYFGNIADLVPSDIASVDVLKDASSTAIYGSRGANGVIIITTKKGVAGKATIDVNSYYGISKASLYPKVATGLDAVTLRREAYRTAGKWASVADDPKIFNNAELADIAGDIYTNYQDLLLHRGNQEDHHIGLSSGSEKTKVYTALDYYREEGLFTMDNITRYSGRVNVDHTINSILKAGMQAQITYNNQNVRADPLNQANKISPLGAAFNPDGSIILYPNGGSSINPLADEQPGVFANNVTGNNTLATTYLELTPIKGLSIRSNFSVNFQNSRNGIYQGANTIARNGAVARSNFNMSTATNVLWENIISYHKEIGAHTFDLTGVSSYQNRLTEASGEQGDGQLLASQIYYGLQGATSGIVASSGYIKETLVSGAGRINYGYKGRYLLTLTGRSDGSSKLGDSHKWTFFPSAAAAWHVTEESFMKNVKQLDDLKLRVSYGVSGNDPYGSQNAYPIQSLLTNVPFSYGETSAPGYTFNPVVGNPDLSWEKSATLDIGVDFGLFNNRVSGTIDVYDTHTSDLLLPRILPLSTGHGSTLQNIGKTNNKGIEISLSTVNVKSKDWKWSSTLTFTANKEKITQLVTEGVNDIASGYFVGQPVGVFYDYQKIGIWQTSEAAQAAVYGQTPGTIKVMDQNGDGKIDAVNDRVILGNSKPKWSGGFDNTVKYKNWDLNVYVYARIGQMINANSLGFNNYQGTTGNAWAASLDYWTPENPTNAYPRPNSNGGLQYISTLTYTDGSFARIRDISLGYTIPKKFTGTFLKGLRVYANGKNLFTYTKLKDYDPERGGSENYPMTKIVLVGVNASF